MDEMTRHWMDTNGFIPTPGGRSFLLDTNVLLHEAHSLLAFPEGEVVIVRDGLLGDMLDGAPTMYNYRLHADAGSMLNTPPTFGWYLAGLVFRWLLGLGGLASIEVINRRKAGRLYEAIDASDFYHSPVAPDCRPGASPAEPSASAPTA